MFIEPLTKKIIHLSLKDCLNILILHVSKTKTRLDTYEYRYFLNRVSNFLGEDLGC
jgi:hypothetical protein